MCESGSNESMRWVVLGGTKVYTAARSLRMFVWLSMTPLGAPVVPEV